MTYMNAMQGVDGLVGGLDTALGVLRQRNQERAADMAHAYHTMITDYNVLAAEHNRGWAAYKEARAGWSGCWKELQASNDGWNRAALSLREANEARVAAEERAAQEADQAKVWMARVVQLQNTIWAAGLTLPP